MSDLSFYPAAAPVSARALAALVGAELRPGTHPDRVIAAVAPPAQATATDLTVFLSGMDVDDLASCHACACCLDRERLARLPPSVSALVHEDPPAIFLRLVRILQVANLQLASRETATVAAPKRLEDGVRVGEGCVIGEGVEIGSGTVLGPLCVIGAGVRIGRNCEIDSHAALSHCLIGDRVLIGVGVRIGHAASRHNEPPFPSIGRVIVQNDVVIGANVVIARGHLDDTVIGERGSIAPLAVVGAGSLVGRAEHHSRSA